MPTLLSPIVSKTQQYFDNNFAFTKKTLSYSTENGYFEADVDGANLKLHRKFMSSANYYSENKEEIKNFGHYFRKICALSISIQEKCKMIKQNPSPLSLLEVKLFMEEGRELCEKYC